MGRRVTTGTAVSSIPTPQTVRIRDNVIEATQTDANLVLLSNGTGRVSTSNLTTSDADITNAAFTSINVSGLSVMNEITEILSSITGATGTVVHDFDNGGIFYHSSIAANFTANFTNVPTDNNRGMAMVLILNQGATGYYPSAVQINGVSETLRWANNVTPTPSSGAGRIDIASFTLIRVGGNWIVAGNYTNYN